MRQFIERIEHLNVERQELGYQIKEVMGEAKGRGYNTKAIRKLIAERKRSTDDLAEEQAMMDMYRAALGMA